MIADRQRLVVVRALVQLVRHEELPRDETHRGQHAEIGQSPLHELLAHHPFARVFEVHGHLPAD
jgi:hypothetical protein